MRTYRGEPQHGFVLDGRRQIQGGQDQQPVAIDGTKFWHDNVWRATEFGHCPVEDGA